jgi:hypothetical protein
LTEDGRLVVVDERPVPGDLRVAARTIENSLLGDRTALKEYARGIQRGFDKYLSMRAITYGRERRWTSSAFWQRRHNESDHAR